MSEVPPPAQVYDALWGLAEASVYFKSLVKLGNRIKFNNPSWIPPDKPEISTSDLPEVTLIAASNQANLQANSSSSKLVYGYEWWIATGDVNVVRGILPVAWAVYCAMSGWSDIIPILTWKNLPFVKRFDFTNQSILLTDSDKNRGVRGFSFIWGCEVEMWFKSDDLKAQNQET